MPDLFKQEILPHIQPSDGEKAEAHQLFWLTAANQGKLPISLAYVQTSKLGVSQIHWLSELALFDFNIIYRLGRTNQSADALSWCPEPNCKLESDSDSNSDDPVVLSCATIYNIIEPVLGDTKSHLPSKKKHRQLVIC